MNKLLLMLLVCANSFLNAAHIGLLIVATGKYIQFVPPLLKSADEHFCVDHEVTYFIFTDQSIDFENEIKRPIVRIEHKKFGWPYDALMLPAAYLKDKEVYKNCDYLFALDADMLFVDSVGSEILGDLVATQHPGYVGRRGTYEARPISTACVKSCEGKYYFAGAFHGGLKDACIKMYETMAKNVQIDLDNGVIALWHDESHANRYFIDHKPTIVLDASYCCPGNSRKVNNAKLIALVKDHNEVRS